MYTDILSFIAVSQFFCFVISPVSIPASVGMTSMGAPNTQFQVCLLELIFYEPFTKYFWLTASAWEDKYESESHSIHGCWILGSYFSRLSLCHPFPTFLHGPRVGRCVVLAIFPNWKAPSSLREHIGKKSPIPTPYCAQELQGLTPISNWQWQLPPLKFMSVLFPLMWNGVD